MTTAPITPSRESPSGAVRALLRWYRPYLGAQRRRLGWVTVGTLIVLACQALIPWLVEVLLHHGHWDMPVLGLLLALVLVLLGVSYRTHIAAHTVANESSLVLSTTVFERMLRSRVLRQDGLNRSSIVMRLTSDIDRVSGAYEATLAFGFPGIGRLVISLALLTVIEWKAGVAMTLASLAFILVRRRIGGRLLTADRERLQAVSTVGETVDETITNARTIAGLRLIPWQVGRFHHWAERAEHRTHEVGIVVSRLLLAAHAAAFTGLVVVVIVALAVGGDDLASVAAALLYVEGAVRGLEALPPWIRDVQLAAASQRRLDDVLHEPDRIVLPAGAATRRPDASPGLALVGLSKQGRGGIDLLDANAALPTGAIVGVVTPPGTEPDALLDLLAGDDNPEAGQVTLDGFDVRAPEVADQVFFVPAESEAFAASAMDLLSAVQPGIDDEEGQRILQQVGLDHLVGMDLGLRQPLGPGGVALTVNEQQRLMLAVGMAAGPRVLLVGSLLALADIDTAIPLIEALSSERQESTVITARTAEVAEAVDLILFVNEGKAVTGTHQQLLVGDPDYAAIWERRLSTADVDLSVIGIDEANQQQMMSRLVTEHYAPGALIYRQGSPADRILFIVSGHVEITTDLDSGATQRVAVLGPGNHCGDLRLTVGERRAESAFALDDCVVRSLSRQAITAGLTGLLDRTAAERRIVESLLREGPATTAELRARLPELDAAGFDASLALLERDGAVRTDGDRISAVLTRAGKSGAADLLDRLSDL